MALHANRSCPTDDELLRLESRDLSPRHAARVRAHLDDCPLCREHVAESAAALRVFREHTRDDSDTPQWATFSHALQLEDEAWRRRQVVQTRRRWSGAAAIAATLIVALIWQRQAEVVLSAETVVSRAIAYEQGQRETATATWIQHVAAIRQADARALPVQAGNATSEPMVSSSSTAQELARRLTTYGFDLSAPLSAKPFQQWRRSTSGLNEQLEPLHDTNGVLLKVSAVAPTGAVRQAELIVRDGSYEPVSQQWLFSDGFHVMFTSFAPAMPPKEELRAEVRDVPAPPAARRAVDLESLELSLRTALHDARVPVGEDMTIVRGDNQLLVQGQVNTAQMLAAVQSEAGRLQHVRARMSLESEAAAATDHAESIALRLWLEQALPTPDAREQFSSRTRALSNELRVAVTTLAQLARRYPANVSAELSADQGAILTALAAKQYEDVTAAYVALEQHVAALAGTVSRPSMPIDLPADWRLRSVAAEQQVTALGQQIDAVLSAAQPAAGDDFVRSTRGQLRPALEAVALAISAQFGNP